MSLLVGVSWVVVMAGMLRGFYACHPIDQSKRVRAGAGMKKEHVSENSIMIYDDVMYPDNVTYEHIGEISIS